MPTPTYVPLANLTLGSSVSSVTFSSIPGTYRDLILVVNGTAGALLSLLHRFNSDSGSNYSRVDAFGDGSTSGSSSGSDSIWGYLSTAQTINILQIMDYSATDKHKSVLSRSGVPSETSRMSSGRWANTSAVTSVQILTSTSTISSGTTFSLYGVSA